MSWKPVPISVESAIRDPWAMVNQLRSTDCTSPSLKWIHLNITLMEELSSGFNCRARRVMNLTGYSSADLSDTSAEVRTLADRAPSLEDVANVLATSSQPNCASFKVEIIA